MHFTESLAEAVIEEYSAPGDLVLDPFAGFGTTLVVAERMNRRGLGIELLSARVDQIRRRVSDADSVLEGDARRLDDLVREEVTLCLTSPPYMTINDHPDYALDAYESTSGDYSTYLCEIEDVFRQVAGLLRPGGHAVLNVANIVSDTVVTPLAWDVARVVSRQLSLRQESFICWDRQPPGITGDYCIVFQHTTQ